MIVYWLILIIPIIGALLCSENINKINKKNNVIDNILIFSFSIILILVIGLRHKVGADWHLYIDGLNSYKDTNFFKIFENGDLAYSLICWLVANIGAEIYLVNLICAIFFINGLIYFSRNTPNQWLALTVSIPYLVIVVAMGYTRQSAAIGFAMIGLVSLENGKIGKFILSIILAALFHKTAIILLLLALFSTEMNFRNILSLVILGVISFLLLLLDYVETLVNGYLNTNEYNSSGAGVRIAMTVFPAILFLFLNKKFNLSNNQNKIWTRISLSSFIFIILLQIISSTTAVDRIALYWIPLQIFVLSRIPKAITKKYHEIKIWNLIIILYSISILFVWLFFAEHRNAWLPYKFYPWEFFIKSIL